MRPYFQIPSQLGNSISDNPSINSYETLVEIYNRKVEAQKWCLGFSLGNLEYHTDIGGILIRNIGYRDIEENNSNYSGNDNGAEYLNGNGADFIMLPSHGYGWIVNPGSPDNQRWGKPLVINALIKIAAMWRNQGNLEPLVYGDISLRNGGAFAPHVSHRFGLDVDIRPIGTGKATDRVIVGNFNYSQSKTRQLINTIRNNGMLSVDSIGFQDPTFVAEGLTKDWRGHKDHLHVRFKL